MEPSGGNGLNSKVKLTNFKSGYLADTVNYDRKAVVSYAWKGY